jgi:hypothetical protein
MPIDPPEPAKPYEPEEPEESEPRDERWDEMRKAVEAAIEMGLTDVSDLTDILNRTRNEDLRAAFNNALTDLTKRMENLRTVLGPFRRMLVSREP